MSTSSSKTIMGSSSMRNILSPTPINNGGRLNEKRTSGNIIVYGPHLRLALGNPTILVEPSAWHSNPKQEMTFKLP